MITIKAIRHLRRLVRETHHHYEFTIIRAYYTDEISKLSVKVDEHVLLLITDGSVTLTSDQEAEEITPGGVILLIERADLIFNNTKGFVITFSYERKSPEVAIIPKPSLWYVSEHFHALQLLAEQIMSLNTLTNFPLETRLQITFLHGILGMIYEEVKHPYEKTYKSEEITAICELIRSNPTKRYSLDYLSRKCNMSLYHFCHLFKENTGVSPNRYLIEIRCNHARNLIKATDKSLKEIAIECGYPDQYSFSKQFKKIIGLTPSSLRRN